MHTTLLTHGRLQRGSRGEAWPSEGAFFEARIGISQTDTNPLMAETPESDIQCVQGQDTFAFAIPVHTR